jgi:kynurenine formamidase
MYLHSNKEIIDLTKVLDQRIEIYRYGSYSDPQLVVETWSTIKEQGFSVCSIMLGTQTGTHIDAPAHFIEGGSTLDQLQADKLIGSYFWIDIDLIAAASRPEELFNLYNGEQILFLSSRREQVVISDSIFKALCSIPARLWVLSGSVKIIDRDPLYFHRAIAERGIYLAEDLDQNAAEKVRPGGELIALPLRLSGASGSPCRIVVLQTTGVRQ